MLNQPSYLRKELEYTLQVVESFNRLIAEASIADLQAAGISRHYMLVAPESANPIPLAGQKPAPRSKSAPTPTAELIQIARGLGMTEDRIAERFGTKLKLAQAGLPYDEKTLMGLELLK